MSVTEISLGNLRVAQMLPDVDLAPAGGGSPVQLRPVRSETTVILLPHAFKCAACERYAMELDALAAEFRAWDARLLVIAAAPDDWLQRLSFAKAAIHERDTASEAAVLVADRYGQVFHITRPGKEHAFPSPPEIVEWLKYLGTLCPE